MFSKENMDVGEIAMALVGADHVAYIRPAQTEAGYAVHAADGTQLAVFANYDAAYFTARRYNLTPVNVH